MPVACFGQNTREMEHNSLLFNSDFISLFTAAGFQVRSELLDSTQPPSCTGLTSFDIGCTAYFWLHVSRALFSGSVSNTVRL